MNSRRSSTGSRPVRKSLHVCMYRLMAAHVVVVRPLDAACSNATSRYSCRCASGCDCKHQTEASPASQPVSQSSQSTSQPAGQSRRSEETFARHPGNAARHARFDRPRDYPRCRCRRSA
eukprot:8651053-Pyramimonas_sp.AAC.1